ncbi:hypothetical protein SUDANB126_02766 [Streptomyces sp. enrichment culture]
MFIRRARAARLDTPGSEAGDPVRTWYGGWDPVLWKTSDNQLEPLNGTRFRC